MWRTATARRALSAAALVLAALLGGCAAPAPEPAAYRHFHTVSKGDTLYSIAWRYGHDFREVAAWNDIEPPYRIFPGDKLVVIAPNREIPVTPEPAPRVTTRADRLAYKEAQKNPPPTSTKPTTAANKSSEVSVRTPRATVSSKPVPVAPPSPRESGVAAAQPVEKPKPKPKSEPKPQAKSVKSGALVWRWPTSGKVVQRFSVKQDKKGFDISGSAGQPVVAAAPGSVVYSGDGLIGYGNLVIIKHSNTYLSAYGHNRKLLVSEGQEVSGGEKIAEMGEAGSNGPILHFEIRRNGKPVDPGKYLPPR